MRELHPWKKRTFSSLPFAGWKWGLEWWGCSGRSCHRGFGCKQEEKLLQLGISCSHSTSNPASSHTSKENPPQAWCVLTYEGNRDLGSPWGAHRHPQSHTRAKIPLPHLLAVPLDRGNEWSPMGERKRPSKVCNQHSTK